MVKIPFMITFRTIVFGLVAIGLFCLIGAVVWFRPETGWPQLLTIFLSACFASAISAADVVESFKASGAGIEATTRAVARVENALSEVQELAAATVTFIVGEAAGSQFWGSLSAATRDAQADHLFSVLARIGLKAEDIEKVRASTVQWDRLVYENAILKDLPERSDPETLARWNAATKPNRAIEDRPSLDEVRGLVLEFGTMTPPRIALLEDLEYLLKHQRHKRPNVWADRDQWMTRPEAYPSTKAA